MTKDNKRQQIPFVPRENTLVPGVVVVYPTFHAWVGWVSEIKYERIAAARGAFTS